MRFAALVAALLAALATAGCVTEGELIAQPASDEEAAQSNLALGVRYLQENRADLAISALERAIELQPRNADAQSTLAVAYGLTGEVELAEQHHRRAAQLAPNEPNTQNRFAVFLCLQNRWRDAEPYFRRAIQNSPPSNPVSIMNNAGNCAMTAGDTSAAEGFFRDALAIEAANVDSLRGMVDLSIATEDFLPARGFWQRLERATTLRAEDYVDCYRIEAELRDQSAAQSCADRMQREFPGSPALRLLRELQRDGA